MDKEQEAIERKAVEDAHKQRAENKRLAEERARAKIRDATPETFEVPDIVDLPQTDDLKELAGSAIPHLVRRAINLAAMSDNLPQVLSVLKELADRKYGKAEQAVTQTVKVERADVSLEQVARMLAFAERAVIEKDAIDLVPIEAVDGPAL